MEGKFKSAVYVARLIKIFEWIINIMNREIPWRSNLSDACREAEKVKKPIFVDWADLPACVGCVPLENNSYPELDVIDFVNDNFVPVQLNQSH